MSNIDKGPKWTGLIPEKSILNNTYVNYYNTVRSIRNNGFDNVTVLAKINARGSMEDYFSIAEYTNKNNNKLVLYTVLDGHGGYKAAAITISELPGYIFKALENTDLNQESEVQKAISQAFIDFESTIYDRVNESGTTVIMVLDIGTDYYFINLGDSRAIYFDSNLIFTTKDHKPSESIETDRIQNMGGKVVWGRVNGLISVSRSLGDFDFNKYDYTNSTYTPESGLVWSYPDITKVAKINNAKIVLATDGLWDRISNKYLIEELNKSSNHKKSLLSLYLDSRSLKSYDNITIMLIS